MVPLPVLRLLTWNLRHGGGPNRGRQAEIVLSLLGHRPDVVVLTEFHAASGGSIRGLLADAGLAHQATSAIDPTTNSILIASRGALIVEEPTSTFPGGASRFLECRLVSHADAILTGIHIPDDSSPLEKAVSWHALIALARVRQEKSWILLGDFNSGRHLQDESGRGFRNTALLGTFVSLGMLDAWRHLHPHSDERSWSHPARGASRIDGCYLSPLVHKCLKTSHFSHTEREAGHSDHSALVVELEGLAASVGCAEEGFNARVDPVAEWSNPLFPAWKTADSRDERCSG